MHRAPHSAFIVLESVIQEVYVAAEADVRSCSLIFRNYSDTVDGILYRKILFQAICHLQGRLRT